MVGQLVWNALVFYEEDSATVLTTTCCPSPAGARWQGQDPNFTYQLSPFIKRKQVSLDFENHGSERLQLLRQPCSASGILSPALSLSL